MSYDPARQRTWTQHRGQGDNAPTAEGKSFFCHKMHIEKSLPSQQPAKSAPPMTEHYKVVSVMSRSGKILVSSIILLAIINLQPRSLKITMAPKSRSCESSTQLSHAARARTPGQSAQDQWLEDVRDVRYCATDARIRMPVRKRKERTRGQRRRRGPGQSGNVER